jgi:hypothetical protein
MMGELNWFGQLFGAIPDGDITVNARVAKAMIRAGLAVVIIERETKLPACTLLARDAKKADKEAQDAAKEKGNANYQHVKHACGIKHAITEEKELTRKRVKDLLENGANLAIAPGVRVFQRTKVADGDDVLEDITRPVMVVDIDTDAQREAFLSDWTNFLVDDPTWEPKEFTGDPAVPLTVTSPGVMKSDGEWIHKNGGHYWMDIPEGVELPERPGKMTWCRCHKTRQPQGGCEHAWAVYWGSGYVLVPPSVRPEGPYRVTGETLEAPAWLLQLITSAPESATEESGGIHLDLDDPIDAWSARTSWEALLTGDDFTPAGHDNCGCPTYTRPGSPAHTKSVTGHEVGCTVYDTSMGHGPLRIWSDALGAKTISKLKYVAENHYGGDTLEAMTALGIATINRMDELDDFGDIRKKGEAPSENGASDEEDDELDELDVTSDSSWATIDWAPFFDGDYEPVTPTMMVREDGAGLVYPGLVHSFHGESESGKSLLLMWEAVRLMNDGQDVLWLTFDSDANEDAGRAKRYGLRRDAIHHMDYRRPDASHVGDPNYADMFKRKYALAVIDGVTDALNLLGKGMTKGDPNDAYTQFSRIFPKRLADRTGAAVVLIDHVSKDSEGRGRFAIGAQAKMSQLTGAAYLVEPVRPPVKGGKGTIVLRVAKDRPGGVRSKSGSWRGKDRTQEACRIQVDDTGNATVFVLEAPQVGDPFDNGGAFDRPEQQMTQISEILQGQTNGLTTNAIQAAVNGRNDRVRLALELLENEGYLEVREGARRSKTYISIKPYNGQTPDLASSVLDETPEDGTDND